MVAPFVDLPPTDRVLSPRTGWTRGHWEALADHLLDSLVPYASPGGAQYRLPGRASWSGVALDGLEGFARSFMTAACRIGGAGEDADPVLVERYARGLDAGTDRRSGEAWPALTDCSQQMVEAASIAVGLHESRAWLWDRLDEKVRERVVDWLSGFVGARTWDNNWRLFQVVAEEFLASVGAPHRRADIDEGLDRIEDWYVGEGWYTDGEGRNFDYYNAWALHLYPLLWARMAGEAGAERAAVYRERLSAFLAPYPEFFGADGAPVHQGRSLTYRFAVTAPVWLGALADCSPLAPGLTRRLASGTARYFVERGAPDARGLLPLGWHGAFLPATQPYSGPASPYWASKGFLGLLLPAGHPVWTERERALPVEVADRCTALPVPGWLLHGTRHDGIVRLVNHGSDHNAPTGPGEDDPHYAKFGYSTANAPESAEHAWRKNVDGHLALLGADGAASRRSRIRPVCCAGRVAASRHEAELPDGAGVFDVETTSAVHGPWEVRAHRVRGLGGRAVPGVREGGYAVAGGECPETSTGPGWSLVRAASGLSSALVALHGWDGEPGTVREVAANAYGAHSATPVLHGRGAAEGTCVLVSLVALTWDRIDPAALRAAVTCEVTGERVRVTWPDGEALEV